MYYDIYIQKMCSKNIKLKYMLKNYFTYLFDKANTINF